MRIKEIEARLAAIKQEIEQRGDTMTAEEIDKLEKETNDLTEERAGLVAAAEKRNGILDNIAKGAGVVSRTFEQKQDNADPDDPFGTPEYRSAWLKHLRRLPLTDAEKRAYANASGTGAEVIPTQTANEIISKVKKLAPMLNEVTLLHVKGAVKFAVEGTNNDAAIHTENAAISPAADTLTTVTLTGYEIIKLVQISDTVMTMSIAAFESWIVDMLAEAIARKVEDFFINGTGSSQPKGIDKANTWGETNSVTVAAAGSLSAANVQTLIGLLNAGYDRNAKFAMSKKSITFDNGSEFADCAGIERSVYGKDRKRTKAYYCHPYSAFERGTNENINKMIRRFLPKGTDFRKVTAAYIRRVEAWINNYPREILGYATSNDLFTVHIAAA